MKNKILLMGGAGYIGTILIEELIKKNYDVICFDSLIYEQNECIKKFLSKKNFQFIKGDIRKKNEYLPLLSKVKDIVLLAGLVGDPITKIYPKESTEINLQGVKNFISECNNFKNLDKVIFVSTCSNYGLMHFDRIADENSPLKPLSSYAEHKVEIEKYIMTLKNKVSFSPVILRFATAFGLSHRMRFDLTVNHFTKDIFNNSNLEVYDSDTWRPYCHVKDFARLILTVLNTKKNKTNFQIFNAGSNKNNFTKKDIITEIVKILPIDNIKYVKGGVDRRNYRVNFDKVGKILNFNTEYSLNYAIKEILNFLKQSKTQKDKINSLGNYKIII